MIIEGLFDMKMKMNETRKELYNLMTCHKTFKSNINDQINDLYQLTHLNGEKESLIQQIKDLQCKNTLIEEYTEILRKDLSKYKIRIGSKRMDTLVKTFDNLIPEKNELNQRIELLKTRQNQLVTWVQHKANETIQEYNVLQSTLDQITCSKHIQPLLEKLKKIVTIQDSGEYSLYIPPSCKNEEDHQSLRPFLDELKIKSQCFSSLNFNSCLKYHQHIKEIERQLYQSKENSELKVEIETYQKDLKSLLCSIGELDRKRDSIQCIYLKQMYQEESEDSI